MKGDVVFTSGKYYFEVQIVHLESCISDSGISFFGLGTNYFES